MKITKKELLEKAREVLTIGPGRGAGEAIVLATARALGYEVTEEPALPERLRHGGGTTSPPYRVALYATADNSTYAWLEAPCAKGWPSQAEAVRRAVGLITPYNARAAVLEVAEELERSGLLPAAAALRLRAAYGDPTP